MKLVSNNRSSSKTHPTRHTNHSCKPNDDEINTQKVKFASLHKDKQVEEEEEHEEAEYPMRQNHKKIWKISIIKNGVNNQQHQQNNFICIKCGKGFHSLKAKCGHMACHSHKAKSPSSSLSVDIYKICSSDDSEIEFEKEDVAISLMMLSKDSANWSGLISVEDSSYTNSVVLEARSISTKLSENDGLINLCPVVDETLKKCVSKNVMFLDDSESMKFRDLRRSKKALHLSMKKLRRAMDEGLIRDREVCNQSKKTKHECLVCFKVSKSGQALGCHRRIHLSEGSDEIKTDDTVQSISYFSRQLLSLYQPY